MTNMDAPVKGPLRAEGGILVIEDDVLVSMGMRAVLEAEGYAVEACRTGEAALAWLATNKAALVLLDVNLTGAMDGIAVAAKISENYSIPFIFVTAKTDAEMQADGLPPLSENKILRKPFAPEQLLSIVAKMLGGTSSGHE